jgi:hypothetical protein
MRFVIAKLMIVFRQIWLSISGHWHKTSSHLVSFYLFSYELCCLFVGLLSLWTILFIWF